MSDQDKPRSSLSSLLSRAQDRVPPLSALPHLARQGVVRVDPRQPAETLQLQLLIKSLSGCVQDRHALAREQQVFAKQLYTWSAQEEKDGPVDDVVDTCDRLAWMVYTASELEQACAHKIEASRSLLKDIRNMENDLVPRRRNEKQLATKIAAVSKEAPAASSTKKADVKAAEQLTQLRAEHAQVETENQTFEASFAALKRQKLREAFALQFAAQRELGEKTALVAAYGELLLQGMDTQASGDKDQGGKARTAQVKVELEAALARWTPGPSPTLAEPSHGDNASLLSRSDTRSFGETHGSRLSELDSNRTVETGTYHSPGHDQASIHSFSPATGHLPPASSLARHHHLSHPPPLATVHSQAELDTSSMASHTASTADVTDLKHSQFHSSVPPPLPPRAASPTQHSSSPLGIPPPPLPARTAQSTSSSSPPFAAGSARINLSPTSPVLPSSPSRALGAVAVDLPPPPSHSGGMEVRPGIAPPEPTVAETGAPIVGTGGPSSGVLSPRRGSLLGGGGGGAPRGSAAGSTAATSTTSQMGPSHSAVPPMSTEATTSTSAIPTLSMPGTFDDAGWGTHSDADEHSTVGTEHLPAYGEGDDEAHRARAQAEAILAQERERKAHAPITTSAGGI